MVRDAWMVGCRILVDGSIFGCFHAGINCMNGIELSYDGIIASLDSVACPK